MGPFDRNSWQIKKFFDKFGPDFPKNIWYRLKQTVFAQLFLDREKICFELILSLVFGDLNIKTVWAPEFGPFSQKFAGFGYFYSC